MTRERSGLPDGTYVVLVKSLYDTLLPAGIMALSVVVAGSFISSRAGDPPLTVLTVLCAVAAIARLANLLVHRGRAQRVTLDTADARILQRSFAVTYLAFAALFGAFAARALQVSAVDSQLLVVGLVFGYGAGVATGVSLRPWIAVPSVLLATLPAVVVACLAPDLSHIGLGTLLALFLGGGIESMIQRYRATALNVTMQRSYAALARQDDLTGLPNRLSLRETFEQRAAAAKSEEIIAVLCLDLDRFKPVNDKYGHPVGDELLCAVSERLNGLLRRGDIAARLGGDEFVIVQTGASHGGEAEMLARRAARAMAQPFSVSGRQITIGASVGYALFPGQGRDLEGLVECADQALVRVKRAGGGVARYSAQAPERVSRLSA
jgi:diguanylate cyclase (GGDEF)-like protein